MSNQEPITTEGKTLKEAAEAYIDELVVTNAAKMSTVNVYQRSLQLAVNFFGADRKLDSILLPQTGKYFASKALNFLPSGRPKAQATIRQNKRVFRQMMEYAQTKGWIITLPIPKGELQHARSSKATGSVTQQPEVVISEPVEAEAQAEA